MSARKVKHRRLKKYSSGDLNNRIRIHTRQIKAPGLDSAEFSEGYDIGKKRWASVETLDLQGSGSRRFDNVELSKRPSHIFVIRFMKDVSVENVIRWKDDLFKIVHTQNPEGRNQYSELFAVLLGAEDLETNQ